MRALPITFVLAMTGAVACAQEAPSFSPNVLLTAPNSNVLTTQPTLDLRDNTLQNYRPGSSVDFDALLESRTLQCPECMTPGEVVTSLGGGTRYYGNSTATLYSLGIEVVGDGTAVLNLRAMAGSVGLFNPLSSPVEFIVRKRASGESRSYDLGPSEVVTIECNDCRSELEVSIETTGRPAYSASFDAGAIVVPKQDAASDRWTLAQLGSD